MSILVTGGAGYIGSVTVDLLRDRGRDIVVLDNLSNGHRSAVAGDTPCFVGSIGDVDLIKRICSEQKIDSCIHFAALAYVGESVSNPRWPRSMPLALQPSTRGSPRPQRTPPTPPVAG